MDFLCVAASIYNRPIFGLLVNKYVCPFYDLSQRTPPRQTSPATPPQRGILTLEALANILSITRESATTIPLPRRGTPKAGGGHSTARTTYPFGAWPTQYLLKIVLCAHSVQIRLEIILSPYLLLRPLGHLLSNTLTHCFPAFTSSAF